MEEEYEEHVSVNGGEVTSSSPLKNNNVIDKEPATITDSKSLTDCKSLVTKVMEFCDQSATLDIKDVKQLWEEFNSASADQV